jgi:hypothetical protein
MLEFAVKVLKSKARQARLLSLRMYARESGAGEEWQADL